MSGEGHRRVTSQAGSPWSRWIKTPLLPVSLRLLGLLLWAFMATVTTGRPSRSIIPRFLNTPNNITAVIGSDVLLPCQIENLGPKTIVWRKVHKDTPISIGDYVFDPDKNYSVTPVDNFSGSNQHHYVHSSAIKMMNLIVTGVTYKHAGTYQCVPSTKEDMVRNVTLNVVEDRNNRMKPMKTGIKLEGTSYVEKGSNIDLNCTATAIDYRPKGLDWFVNGSRVRQGGRRLITDQYMGDANVVHSRLEIERAVMSDAGTYVCRFSQLHVRDIKVIVLNTDSSNRRRGTGTEGLDIAKPGSSRNEDYYGTVSREKSHHSSTEDAASASTLSVTLTVFLVILALVST